MKLTEIKNIEEILLIEKPVLRHKIRNLAAPAENNGSFLLVVELRLKNEKNFEEKFEVVAKLAAPNGNIHKLESFKNEIAFYTRIVPRLQQFLKFQGVEVNLFPKYYGGRLSLKSRNKETDKNGVFLLENLKFSGFQTLDPTIGFNLETTKLILKELSRFHAIFLALKLNRSEVFKHEVRPYINSSTEEPDNSLANETKQVVSLMWENEACVSLIPRIRRAMSQKRVGPPQEPFATIIHSDFWTNNVMVKLKDDTAEEIKIVDFQYFTYGSPATDLVFFLFSSVETIVLEEYLDELIKYYYDSLIATLQNLECDVTSFSIEEFIKEVTTEAKSSQFVHVIKKLNSIFTPKHAEEHKEKVWYVVQEFAKRNWI